MRLGKIALVCVGIGYTILLYIIYELYIVYVALKRQMEQSEGDLSPSFVTIGPSVKLLLFLVALVGLVLGILSKLKGDKLGKYAITSSILLVVLTLSVPILLVFLVVN